MTLMKKNRRQSLAEAVNRAGEMSFSQIKALFPTVSDMTLRSDLKELDDTRLIVRIHGGAKSIDQVVRADDLFYRKASRHINEKKLIAQKAVALLKPGMSLFIDCGTTTLELARALPDEKYFIVTNSVACMPELSRLTKVSVDFLGGQLNRFNLSTLDARNRFEIEKRNFDIAFISVTGYSETRGFTCGTEVDDDLRATAIRRAEQAVALMDSSKVGRVFPVTYAQADDIDVLITDDMLPDKYRRHFVEQDVKVL